jgi:cupin fold WbuC family metalloprotein
VETPPIKRLNQELLDVVSEKAQSRPRLRQNHDFHELSEKVQRFLNALQPGTYVRPHRHLRDGSVNGFEFFLVLQGAIGMLILDEQGQVLHTEQINAQGPTRGLELGQGQYHTLVALEPNTVMFELKEGPYQPSMDKDFLPMFPSEGTPEAQQWVSTWQSYFQS